jgi:hypothetical protein
MRVAASIGSGGNQAELTPEKQAELYLRAGRGDEKPR